jgi:ribonuclease HI
MLPRSPHYILYTEATPCEAVRAERPAGQWRFILEPVGGGDGRVDNGRVEHSDVETEVEPERLELLSLVRGLEALDQPSRVTLCTNSRYVRLGLQYGIAEARLPASADGSPLANSDLWGRVAQALHFHKLDCRMWRIDGPHRRPLNSHHSAAVSPSARVFAWLRSSGVGARLRDVVGGCVRRLGLA